MADHHVAFTVHPDGHGVQAVVTCDAHLPAPCRNTCADGHIDPCECERVEYWECMATEWWDAEGVNHAEYYGGPDGMTAKDGPVSVSWSATGWTWNFVPTCSESHQGFACELPEGHEGQRRAAPKMSLLARWGAA